MPGERSEWSRQVNHTVAEVERRLEAHARLLAEWGERLAALERALAPLGARVEGLEGQGHVCSYPDQGVPHTHEVGHQAPAPPSDE